MAVRNQFIVGTATSVGKNTIACCLLSAARRSGISATPFKPFAIDVVAHEQCVSDPPWTPSISHQAIAAGRTPSAEMNPIRLLYHTSDRFTCNVWNEKSTTSDFKQTESLCRTRIEDALEKLKPFDVVICEGSGGMVDGLGMDVFNRTVADLLDPEIVLVANARNGGAYAQLVGTLALMDERAVCRVRSLVINEMNNSIHRPIFWEFCEIVRARFGVDSVEVVPTFSSIDIDESEHVADGDAYFIDGVDFVADRMRVCAPSLFEFLPA